MYNCTVDVRNSYQLFLRKYRSSQTEFFSIHITLTMRLLWSSLFIIYNIVPLYFA